MSDTNIPTRLYIDYKTAVELIDDMGEKSFIELLDECRVVTMDRESYHLITSIIDSDEIKTKEEE